MTNALRQRRARAAPGRRPLRSRVAVTCLRLFALSRSLGRMPELSEVKALGLKERTAYRYLEVLRGLDPAVLFGH